MQRLTWTLPWKSFTFNNDHSQAGVERRNGRSRPSGASANNNNIRIHEWPLLNSFSLKDRHSSPYRERTEACVNGGRKLERWAVEKRSTLLNVLLPGGMSIPLFSMVI